MFVTQDDFGEILELLLDHRASINAETDEGHTALHIAAENGHLDTVKILMERGMWEAY